MLSVVQCVVQCVVLLYGCVCVQQQQQQQQQQQLCHSSGWWTQKHATYVHPCVA